MMSGGAEMTKQRSMRVLVVVVLVLAVLVPAQGIAGAASSASGVVEHVDESFQSMRWTAECGFPVWRRNYGTQRIWEEPRGGGGILFRGVFALTVELTGVESGKTYRLRDRGTGP
jgi:hypothetical protein